MAEVKQYVFFDFEMLCSNRGMPFANMEGIRLGAVKYNLETKEIAYFDRFIKPKQSKPLSQFCKSLTQINDEDLATANQFPVVFQDFVSWVDDINQSRFFSWSVNDLLRLELDASSYDFPQAIITNIKERYIDFQAIFTKRVSKTNLSVENALALYQLRFEGEKHNPMFDAYNTLRIFLAFNEQLVSTDLIMLQQFIFTDKNITFNSNINLQLKNYIKHDLQNLFKEITVISNIRTGKKLVKRTGKLVKKYENILINRAQLFNEEILLYIRVLSEFYRELRLTYRQHDLYGCKTMIIDEHLTTSIQRLAA